MFFVVGIVAFIVVVTIIVIAGIVILTDLKLDTKKYTGSKRNAKHHTKTIHKNSKKSYR